MKRREFLKGAVSGAATLSAGGLASLGCDFATPPPSDGWDRGPVAHLIPAADHRRILLKASFDTAFEAPPQLAVGARRFPGRRLDSEGRFFDFYAGGLTPSTQYTLSLFDSGGGQLCDTWPLRTPPPPDSTPERLRILTYTCAGGSDELYDFGIWNAFVPIANRQRMLARALSFDPDLVIANGDHVYWDLESSAFMGRSPRAWWLAGLFDRSLPVLGTSNEAVMKRAFGPQLAGLYGVLLRSTPAFFLQDDHDYGENDEATESLRTFPPDPFMLDLARSSQRLYYPEFLDDGSLPREFVSSDGRSENFGRLRYGRLFEALLYDCRRFISNAEDPALGHRDSRFVPEPVERWLLNHTARSDVMHLAHMPSTPILWTAGKWGEWYPDVKDADGVLGRRARKPYWPEGWNDQHDRLLAVASGRKDRTPLFISGDLHAFAAGRIHATRGKSFETNPPVSILTGAPGTGPLGWPSKFRGQIPLPSETIDAETMLDPLEENGFSLLDITPDNVRVSFFGWLPERGEAALDTLEPSRVFDFPRPGRA